MAVLFVLSALGGLTVTLIWFRFLFELALDSIMACEGSLELGNVGVLEVGISA